MERLYSEKVPVPPKLQNYKKLHSSIIKTKLETLMLAMKYVYTGNTVVKVNYKIVGRCLNSLFMRILKCENIGSKFI